MALTPPPVVPGFTGNAPNRNNPGPFSADMDTYLGEMQPNVDGLNAATDWVNDEAVPEVQSIADAAQVSANDSAASAGQSATSAGESAASAADALTSENEAEASALSAANSAASSGVGFVANSLTSQTIAIESKTFAIETGKNFVIGQNLKIASAADVANNMSGVITAASDGSITVLVDAAEGSGTHSDWSISLNIGGGSNTQTAEVLNYSVDTDIPGSFVVELNPSAIGIKAVLSETTEGDLKRLINTSSNTVIVELSGSGFATIEPNEMIFAMRVDSNWLVVKSDAYENQQDLIAFGISDIFNTGNSNFISITTLSTTQVVVAYQDASNSNYGTAIVGTISGNSITFGSEVVFNTGNSLNISIATLSTTQVVVAYRGNVSYGTAIVGTISGNSITFGSEVVFNAGVSIYTSITTLSATQVVVAYQDASNSTYGTAIVGTISGNSITFGSEVVFNAGASLYTSIATLSATQVVVAYRDASNSNYGTAIVGTISGNSITFGSEVVFNAGVSNFISIATISATQVVVAYRDDSNSNYGTAIVGTISGNSITFGSEVVFNAGSSDQAAITTLSATQVVVAYRDNSNSTYGTAIVGTISGSSITFGSEVVFNAGNSVYTSIATLSATQVVVAYRDDSNSNYGTAIVGNVL